MQRFRMSFSKPICIASAIFKKTIFICNNRAYYPPCCRFYGLHLWGEMSFVYKKNPFNYLGPKLFNFIKIAGNKLKKQIK